ncbi:MULTISPECIES: energy transducer TonB [unclassified Pseudomonas]|jgi:protein TonB|uniref:energy transducer TonB n=1 Tax=unclassified Pseudomonas TaxID=196821 RepID=UPI000C877B15|nr:MULTISPECIES: energy transducer TonB [unclassified Pseudomonas]PMU08359.1 energy transducer TonB [Pseudomonas sp. FW305-20]PMU19207.1 energy transducer TonB [Pseudomonas sp. FW305-122]PMU35927.1 energy transducer TonB [Pseudomonas sp. FW305-47B]PMX60824.1 energy transducer TonB [Pseudomonas sp. FW305-33]PMX65382.1 energy transducer TonB [Pseudomonas sp. FW305-60]
MTAMIMHTSTISLQRSVRSGFWQNSLAAGLAGALHVIVLALLVHGWSLEKTPATQPTVLRTQLVMLPPQPQAPEPVPASAEPAPPEPVAAAPVESIKPAVDPQLQIQKKLEQAALARKRVDDKKREQQAEQQRERQETQRRNREAEQQQRELAQQQEQQEQQAQRAEQARLAAERSRQLAAQKAADSRQYLPLSKEAPDYPQRALDKNIEGDCSVEYTVNPQGKVESPRVLEGCHPLFIRPSLAAANTFRYQPRIVDGQAVPVPAVRNTFHYRIK